MASTKPLTPQAAVAQPNDDPNRRVLIELFCGRGQYSKPLFVSVNDYTALIPRGVPVDVPFFAAQVIAQAEAQEQRTTRLIEQESEAFARMQAALAR